METDLFGDVPQPLTHSKCGPKGGKHYTRPNGYAGAPGRGPAGETCGSCAHICRQGNYSGSKRWLKCALAKGKWTNGRGSDILARSPACEKWQSSNKGDAHG